MARIIVVSNRVANPSGGVIRTWSGPAKAGLNRASWNMLDDRGQPSAVDVVYLVVGKVTGLLAQARPGDRVEVWGPLGNGFPELHRLDHVGLVAGGIGQTPFLAHVREWLGYVWVCLADPPPPFEEQVIGAVTERLGDAAAIERYGVENLTLGRRTVYDVKANWKLVFS